MELFLDGFKKVNDQFGHAAGDRLLARVAEVLSGTCRKGDHVARMDGDEFVLLLPGARREALAERTCQLNRLVSGVGRELYGVTGLGLSVGTSFYPDDGHTGEELLATADARMYEMKRDHNAQAARAADLMKLAAAVEQEPGIMRAGVRRKTA